MAKAFGQSPILLASQYKLFSQDYLDGLTGFDQLLIDHAILNRVISEENRAQEAARKKAKEEKDHPGMERFESEEDFWDEVENGGN